MGNTPGGKVLSFGKSTGIQQFGRHLVTSGLHNLYEGMTLCHPTTSVSEEENHLHIAGTSSDNNPCILTADWPHIPDTQGRVVIDCKRKMIFFCNNLPGGFTKLYNHWNTAGTSRYVPNICVWLLGLDHRFSLGTPLKGKAFQSFIG